MKVYFLVKLSHSKILREFESKYYYINELFHGNKIYILKSTLSYCRLGYGRVGEADDFIRVVAFA